MAAAHSYVTGYFVTSATFGAGEPNETTLTSAASTDIFVARYDASGLLLWATRAGGAGDERGLAIAVDGSGNSYVTGRFRFASATFGAGEPNETTLTSAGASDIFVAKYDAGGMLLWATRDGGEYDEYGLAIAVDGSGSSYVTGYFQESQPLVLASPTKPR